MWSLPTPPQPNTSRWSIDGFVLGDKDMWAPCDGKTYNGIATPDLRNRFPLGQGNWNVSLTSTTGGEVPIRNHIHAIFNDGKHRHQVPRDSGTPGNNYALTDTKNSDEGMNWNPGTSSEGEHNHGGKVGHAAKISDQHIAVEYRMDNYDKNTVPYSTVVQYWIRVR